MFCNSWSIHFSEYKDPQKQNGYFFSVAYLDFLQEQASIISKFL